MDTKVNLTQVLATVHERWRPHAVAAVNDYSVKLVKLQGEFAWHSHSETDELFLVLEGHLVIQLRDGDVELDDGELFVVRRGVEHCPKTEDEAHVLLIEPAGTVNTGD